MKYSYSRKGTPYDNAGIESFHAPLKKEEVYTTNYLDFEEANRALFSYIEGCLTEIESMALLTIIPQRKLISW
ncbi:integrase core domain-containing protein [Enterococcus sp. ALS3]|uniref:Integrase core domain-containing protein n=1 Tax=Enterococcus alishanensis TaxID=1303817 RepID=A0ABS6THT3_9ENTE|nr:integrase core domain-containing protein [Enterococcus alishanensis]